MTSENIRNIMGNIMGIKIQQVFLYVTGKCNANCIMCYLYGNYNNYEHVPLSTAIKRLEKYIDSGAYKVTFLGGEPTLHPQLGQIITAAKGMGYTYLRLVTNGMFNSDILYDRNFLNLNTITFSVDGHTNEINCSIRQGIDLDHVISNMQKAVKLGYDVRVNTTINSMNIDYIEEIIDLCVANGASQINLNIVFLKGAALNRPDLEVDPERWLQVYRFITKSSKKYPIEIKIPLGYVKNNSKPINESEKCTFFAEKDSKLYVMPDGKEYSCLLFINTQMPMQHCNIKNFPICQMLSQVRGYLPLCIYFKKRCGSLNNETQLGEQDEKVENSSAEGQCDTTL